MDNINVTRETVLFTFETHCIVEHKTYRNTGTNRRYNNNKNKKVYTHELVQVHVTGVWNA